MEKTTDRLDVAGANEGINLAIDEAIAESSPANMVMTKKAIATVVYWHLLCVKDGKFGEPTPEDMDECERLRNLASSYAGE